MMTLKFSRNVKVIHALTGRYPVRPAADDDFATLAYIQKTQFSIFFMNWQKLRSPDTATFKNIKISL